MITLNNNQNINKEYILSRISQEQLFEFYMGDCIIGGRVSSPLRKDDSPSFSLFYSKSGDILWKDFGSGKHGDIWNLVMALYSFDYHQAVAQVYKDTILGLSPIQSVLDLSSYKRERQKKEMFVDYRPYQNYDEEYWFGKYFITKRLLKLFNIYTVQGIYINGLKLWGNSKYNPIYQYLFPDESFKGYRPYGSKGNKFTGNANSTTIMGWEQLPPGKLDLLIITKSLKDCVVYRTLGYYAISAIAEGVYLNSEQLELIRSKADNVLVNLDFDGCGIRTTKYYKKLGFKYFFISCSRKDKSEKDISDYLYKNGFSSTIKLLTKLIK